MQTRPVFSATKMLGLTLLACLAIMAALFAYHASQKPVKPLVPPEIGLIFTAPRDIKPFALSMANGARFTEKNLYQHWTLLFFGFTHCSSICPTTLETMKRVYPALHDRYPALQFVFISIDPERDALLPLSNYVHAYHPDFMAATGKVQDLHQLQAQLGVYSGVAPDISGPASSNKPSEDYQLTHTASLMLIDPHGRWVGTFNYGIKPDALIHGIQSSISP